MNAGYVSVVFSLLCSLFIQARSSPKKYPRKWVSRWVNRVYQVGRQVGGVWLARICSIQREDAKTCAIIDWSLETTIRERHETSMLTKRCTWHVWSNCFFQLDYPKAAQSHAKRFVNGFSRGNLSETARLVHAYCCPNAGIVIHINNIYIYIKEFHMRENQVCWCSCVSLEQSKCYLSQELGTYVKCDYTWLKDHLITHVSFHLESWDKQSATEACSDEYAGAVVRPTTQVYVLLRAPSTWNE